MKSSLTILLIIFSLFSFSQQENNKWRLYKEINGVEINYKYQECHDTHNGLHQELVLFQFVNNTKYDFSINFDFSLIYSNVKSSVTNRAEQHKTIVLKASSVIESTCFENREYAIFSKFLNYKDKSELQKFDLINLKINPIKL